MRQSRAYWSLQMRWARGATFGTHVFYIRSVHSRYFDAATTSPIHPVAQQAYTAALSDGWADPTRLYTDGRRARMLLDAARESLAESLGVFSDEVVFTPSGTAAVQTGSLGVMRSQPTRDLFIHGAAEHSSVLHSAVWHERLGGRVASILVDGYGRLRADVLPEMETSQAGVICTQSANHEVGTIQPLAEILEAANGVPVLVDASASISHDAPPQLPWSLLVASPRTWGSVGGCGILVIRRGTRWRNPWPGDDSPSDKDLTPVDIPSAVAAAASLRAIDHERASNDSHLRQLTQRIREGIPEAIADVEVVGHPTDRLPHIVTFSALYVDGESLLNELNHAGFAVSSGSACTSSQLQPSHVLEAMGVLSHGNIRVSLPPTIESAEVERFIEVTARIVGTLRNEAGVDEL